MLWLIVEKDEVSLGLWQRFLELAGHKVVHVDNATNARDLIEGSTPFDVLVTGNDLAGRQTGFGLVQLATSLPHRQNMLCALVTGRMGLESERLREECEFLGAHFWERGIDIEDKIKEIESLVSA